MASSAGRYVQRSEWMFTRSILHRKSTKVQAQSTENQLSEWLTSESTSSQNFLFNSPQTQSMASIALETDEVELNKITQLNKEDTTDSVESEQKRKSRRRCIGMFCQSCCKWLLYGLLIGGLLAGIILAIALPILLLQRKSTTTASTVLPSNAPITTNTAIITTVATTSGSTTNPTTSGATVATTTKATTVTTTTSTTTTTTPTTTTCNGAGLGTILSFTPIGPWRTYVTNFTATKSMPTLVIGMDTGGSGVLYLDDVSVVDITAPSIQLIKNGDFQTSSSSLVNWDLWCTSFCALTGGTGALVSNGCSGSGNYCFQGSCGNGFLYLVQSFAVTIGHHYTISFACTKTGTGITLTFDVI